MISECWNQWLRAPAVPRPPSRSPSCGASREPRSAGASPKVNAAAIADGGGKRQHPPIEREARRAHGLGHEPFEKSHGGKRERESGQRAERGEHQAFGEELRDQPAAARSQRRAHRDFPAARRAARKQQIRQIDARDQQQRRRRAQQQDQRGSCSCPRSLRAEA